MSRLSIRKQLIGMFMPILLVLFVGSALLSYWFVTTFATELFDRDLVNCADSVIARVRMKNDKIVADIPPAAQAILKHDNKEKFYYSIIDETGKRISGDSVLPAPSTDLQLDIPKIHTSNILGRVVRIVEVKSNINGESGDGYVVVQFAQTMNRRNQFQEQMMLSIAVAQIIGVAIGGIAIWYGVAKILTPLKELQAEMSKRSPADLSPIRDVDSPEEVYPLVKAINQLLSRSREAIDTHKRFIANAAHQLRTPIAGLKTYSSIGAEMKETQELQHVVKELDLGIDRASRMVSQMLALARTEVSESSVERQITAVNLADLVQEVVSDLAQQSMRNNLELSFDSQDNDAIVHGDATGIKHLVTNIIENAVLYTPKGGRISVGLNEGTEAIVLSVSDTGPGIPPDQRQKVFERFYRIVGTKVTGSGLGLSIVQEVANAHHAIVTIQDNPDGVGTCVQVSFPKGAR